MTTVINNPTPQENTGSGVGTIITIIALVIVGFLIYRYGVARNSNAPSANIDINLPTQSQ